jgi:hypothetical protein
MTQATILAMLLLALLAGGASSLAAGCRHVSGDTGGEDDDDEDDDDGVFHDYDSDGIYGPCDQLIDLYMEVIEKVCQDYPDCEICDPGLIDTDPGQMPSDSECQMLLDEFDYDMLFEAFVAICEIEANG